MSPCFHCGEPIPMGADFSVAFADSPQPVCCLGCKAAAEWIAGLGLDDYYRLRTESGTRPETELDFSAWDRPALARLHVRQHAPDRAEIVLLIENLRCAACGWLIERTLGSVDGVREVGVNAPAQRVRLVFDPARARLSELMGVLGRLGYVPHPLDASALESVRQKEDRAALKRLVIAGLGAMQAMMYAVALYAGTFDGIDTPTRDFFRWLGFLVATPVVLYSARPFFAGAWREWRTRRLSMDTPIALAIALIYAASLAETVMRGREIYFDSVSMFAFFLLAARYIEMRARHRAGDLVDALVRLQPSIAERLTDAGTEHVGIHELVPGDRIRIGAGAIVPADGILSSAACRIDESLLTGESTPLRRALGDTLIAGSLVVDGPVEARVERIGADTVLAGIVRMVTRAATGKPAIVREADRRAGRFVLRVFAVTLATAVVWVAIDASRAFAAALSVLAVSCPCAFALAVPSALTRAIAVLARRGVLVVDGDALEALARADVFVFDKTGTLTEPQTALGDVIAHRGSAVAALSIAAALEQGSSHPLAQAMRTAATGMSLPHVADLKHVAGAGVSGIIDGVAYRLGHVDFACSGAPTHDRLVLTDVAGTVAEFSVHERPRPGAHNALAGLRADGASIEILSGDTESRVASIVAQLPVDSSCARATPAEKLAHIERLRADGYVVAMVGDGINDAPVLAAAHIAIGIASGAALAQAASGLLLAGNRLDELPRARAVARSLQRVLRQNLSWAFAYNLAAVPLAALGWVPPWLAAIGMSASSLVVVLNSLRIDVPREPAPATPQNIQAVSCEAGA
jgi:P-type Cu2+ transporter